MNYLVSDGPIIACSTSQQMHAAMAVIRISGFDDLSIFQKFFTLDFSKIIPRKVYFTKLIEGEAVLDDLCLTFFQGPKSYNGENILELSVHGNTLNIERILSLFVNTGVCKHAAPGEFTFRALKNKKLTLSQVEGLDLFLNANSSYALEQGLSLLSGSLHEFYLELQELFLRHKASLELSIDFLDDIGEEQASAQLHQTLQQFSLKFESLVKRVTPHSSSLFRPEITLAGLPNSGKSSLFNLLLSEERAIVSPIAGTTRDFLSEFISVGGVNYRLIDTAGIRSSSDIIEAEGIKRSLAKVRQSFFSILLINPFETDESLAALLHHPFDFISFTHADLPGFTETRHELQRRFPVLGSIGAISLKFQHQQQVDELLDLVNRKYLRTVQDQPILLERHKVLILQASQVLAEYQKLITYENDVAILSSELNTLGHCLSELLGIISPDQVLNSIFSNFCIGK
jgi:tRNA modification GTPase